jgi:hypothetical protein
MQFSWEMNHMFVSFFLQMMVLEIMVQFIGRRDAIILLLLLLVFSIFLIVMAHLRVVDVH